jgi:P-loop containing NTP hydrolase pore-1
VKAFHYLNLLYLLCSACLLPPADYPLWDSIGDDIVNRGLLSQLQLEGVMYASMKHLQLLPSGQREYYGPPMVSLGCTWRACGVMGSPPIASQLSSAMHNLLPLPANFCA